MSDSHPDQGNAWAVEQIATYAARRDAYVIFADALRDVFGRAVRTLAPQALVQARPKSIPSFAEKIARRRDTLRDPVNELTDLCGARVITLTRGEVRAVCDFIERNFDIDWDNSVNITDRHGASEFGYRSLHYIVSFRPGVFPTRDVPVEIPDLLLPGSEDDGKTHLQNARAEIQVRTLLEHAWAAINHDRVYKAGFVVPAAIEREFATTAAVLESADSAFAAAIDRLAGYRSRYGAYQPVGELEAEISLLKFVQTHSPDDIGIAKRIAALAAALGDWGAVITALEPHAACDDPDAELLRDLGVALCEKHGGKPDTDEYSRGRRLIENALSAAPDDATALEALARTWDGIDDEEARELYRQAYARRPDDPYLLSAFLQSHIASQCDADVCQAMAPAIRDAIDRCEEHAAVSVNMPDALFTAGLLYLLLGEPYEAMDALARGVSISTGRHYLVAARHAFGKIDCVRDSIEGWEWADRLLLLGLAARFPADEDIRQVEQRATAGAGRLAAPLAILAGGASANTRDAIDAHAGLLRDAFRDFEGTLISGGTQEGVGGLAGRLRSESETPLRLVGYLPRSIPLDATVDEMNYDELRRTRGEDFSPLEPTQYWIDIIASGIDPADVHLIGINGGRIATVEYQIALALGATVILVEGSGRAVSQLTSDRLWSRFKRLLPTPADSATLQSFLRPASHLLDDRTRELIAEHIHLGHSEERRSQLAVEDPALESWEHLDETLRQSNRGQADDIGAKLEMIGCDIVTADSPPREPFTFTEAEIELLAEREHGRWNAERLISGWRWAPTKSVPARLSPYIVTWECLPDDVKEWDRQAVRRIPQRLAEVGLEIRRRA